MPASPPATSRGIPRFNNADAGADFSTAINSVVDAINSLVPSAGGLAALAGTAGSPGGGNKYVTDADSRLSSLVTVLPGSPVDGQVVDFLADAAAGVVWRLRYRAASTSVYKWEFVGGSSLLSEVSASESTNSTAFTGLTTAGPSITIPTLPSGGDFVVEVGAFAGSFSGSRTASAMSYKIGVTPASAGDGVVFDNIGDSASLARTQRKIGITSASVLLAQYSTGLGTIAATFAKRFMSVTPVRVG